MQVNLNTDEAWSLMTVITSYAIDKSGVSQDGKGRIRKWRTDRSQGMAAMEELADGMNDALAAHMGERSARQVRQKGRYARKAAK